MAERRDRVSFCREIQGRLTGSLALYCGDLGLAEELAQETLVRVLERWASVSVMASPEAWAYKVAFNLARSSFRRKGIERRAHARLDDRARLGSADLPDTATAVAVRAAVSGLPDRQRAVIVARFYADLSVEDTRGRFDVLRGTVKAHTFRAIQALRSAGLLDTDEEDNDATTG